MTTKVFDLASKMNVVRNQSSFNALLGGWCEKGSENQVNKVIKRMKAARVDWNQETCHILVRFYCKMKNMRPVTEILRKMKKLKLKPDTHINNMRIRGWIEAKDVYKLRNVSRILNSKMRKQRKKYGLCPQKTIETYNLLINGFAQIGGSDRMEEAEKVMEHLLMDRYSRPNNETFCALFRGYMNLKERDHEYRAEMMLFWLCKMRDFKIKPNVEIVKPFTHMKIYFPSVDSSFWTTDFGMPYDPLRHVPQSDYKV